MFKGSLPRLQLIARMMWCQKGRAARRAFAALALPLTLALTGCIFSEPPDLTEPMPIAPRVFMEQAVPTVLSPVQTSSSEARSFQVPFESDDLGDEVFGALYLNYDLKGQEVLLGTQRIAGGTLEDGPREMEVPWVGPRAIAAGCYSVTMAISRGRNFTFEVVPKPIDPEMTAFVVWWIVHDIAPQDINLDECFANDVPLL